MRILLVVLIGLVLTACGQDYEEVYGIKIGANLSELDDLSEYEEDFDSRKSVDGKALRFFHKEGGDDAFKGVEILAVDNVIETVYLSSVDGVVTSDDVEVLAKQLEKRWGKLEEYEKGWVVLAPKSNIVGYVELFYSADDRNFLLTYSKEKPEFTLYDVFRYNSEPELEYNKEIFKTL